MLLGVLKNSSAMLGVLDLGGGSVQITFHSKVDKCLSSFFWFLLFLVFYLLHC